jgi:NADH-quinone oxidoreductase subunit J
MITELLWWVFASMALGGALGTITRKNPIGSLLFLIITFFALASIYIMLGAQFIGAIQIIVYAGAIMVLFLFVIMLLNLGYDYRSDMRGGLWIVIGFVCAGIIGYVLSWTFADNNLGADDRAGLIVDSAVRDLNAVGAIAFPLFRDFTVQFEITSLLLLVAAIGAVLLAKKRV